MTLNKRPISWHEENFKNFSLYYESEVKRLEKLKTNVERMHNDLEILKKQINYAKEHNISEFDTQETKIKNITKTINRVVVFCKI